MKHVLQQQRCEPLAVDAREAARLLGIGWRSVVRLTSRGELPSVLVGRRRLFLIHQLREWLESRVEGVARPQEGANDDPS